MFARGTDSFHILVTPEHQLLPVVYSQYKHRHTQTSSPLLVAYSGATLPTDVVVSAAAAAAASVRPPHPAWAWARDWLRLPLTLLRERQPQVRASGFSQLHHWGVEEQLLGRMSPQWGRGLGLELPLLDALCCASLFLYFFPPLHSRPKVDKFLSSSHRYFIISFWYKLMWIF